MAFISTLLGLRPRHINRLGKTVMTDNSQETLAALKRMLEAGSPAESVLKAAYQLGYFDGSLAMAMNGQTKKQEKLAA